MERYTLPQRIAIIKIHYKNGRQLAVTVRKTKAFFGRRNAPSRTAIQKLVDKFELLGHVSDVKHKTRARRSRTTDNIAAVARSVEENPDLSIPRRSLELGIPQTSLYRILHKDLVGLNPDKSEWETKADMSKNDYESAVKDFEANGGSSAGEGKQRGKVASKPAKKRKKTDDTDDEEEVEDSD